MGVNPMTLTTDHALVSRILMEQAQTEFDSGDLIQASEKAWGATARALKAIAQPRDWRHSRHYDYVQIIGRLEEATGREELRRGFQAAQAVHANFYEGWMTETQVRKSIADVERLVADLHLLIDADDI